MEKQYIELERVYKELCQKFEEGKSRQDAKILRAFMDDKRIVDFRGQHPGYLHLRILRAKAYILFGNYLAASREYQLSVKYAPAHEQWTIWLQQGDALLHYLIRDQSTEEKDALSHRCQKALTRAMENIPKGKDAVFQRLTVAGLQAFLEGFQGKADGALLILQKMNFQPIPIPQYNNKNELVTLFRHYFHGLAVAIETKNRKLLLQMLKVISIDDQILYGETNLFRLFWTTMNQTFDMRPEFAEGFNDLFNQRAGLAPAYPNLRYFLDCVGAGMQTALELFFREFV